MGDPITNEVLAERLGTLHDDLRDIKLDIAKLVSREVYEAHRLADAATIATLARRVDVLETERQRDAKAAADQMRALMRWVIGAVVVPILLAIWQIYMNTHGVVKP